MANAAVKMSEWLQFKYNICCGGGTSVKVLVKWVCDDLVSLCGHTGETTPSPKAQQESRFQKRDLVHDIYNSANTTH